jgi:CheY-like chemotaxis protein
MADQPGSESAAEPLRILIAEDDPVSLRRLEATLQRWGYEVISARDGKEALERFRATRPQVALLDWLMPELDGVDVCREIRELPEGAEAQLILVSSRAERSDVAQALESGADGHLAKPWGSVDLRAHLRVAERVLRRQAALRRGGGSETAFPARLPGGLLEMCAYCRKVRDASDHWVSLESFLYENHIRFSHGICPGCYPALRAGATNRTKGS